MEFYGCILLLWVILSIFAWYIIYGWCGLPAAFMWLLCKSHTIEDLVLCHDTVVSRYTRQRDYPQQQSFAVCCGWQQDLQRSRQSKKVFTHLIKSRGLSASGRTTVDVLSFGEFIRCKHHLCFKSCCHPQHAAKGCCAAVLLCCG